MAIALHKSVNNLGFTHVLVFCALLMVCATASRAQTQSAARDVQCGEVVKIQSRENSTTRYAFVPPPKPKRRADTITIVLLAGGSGHVNLDEKACPRGLKGNSLVRSIPIFNAAGFGTALVDAPSDFQGEDGLAGFRTAPEHAHDLGMVIAELRARTQGMVWVVGTSRGSISAANVVSRLSGPSAPDGVVLTSALMSGQSPARKAWVAQTVFDLQLENIRTPLLVIGHAADKCIRSPPDAMDRIVARTPAIRQQVVTVIGAPGSDGPPSLNACEGRSPHGFLDQEAEVAAGIMRFIRGGKY